MDKVIYLQKKGNNCHIMGADEFQVQIEELRGELGAEFVQDGSSSRANDSDEERRSGGDDSQTTVKKSSKKSEDIKGEEGDQSQNQLIKEEEIQYG